MQIRLKVMFISLLKEDYLCKLYHCRNEDKLKIGILKLQKNAAKEESKAADASTRNLTTRKKKLTSIAIV